MSKDWVTFPAVAIRGTSLERAREREREPTQSGAEQTFRSGKGREEEEEGGGGWLDLPKEKWISAAWQIGCPMGKEGK